MHPQQVLDLQADMIARSTVPGWKELVKIALTEDLKDAAGGVVKNADNLVSIHEQAERFTERIHYSLGRAHTYFVAPNMTDMITWAAASLDQTDAFRFDEVPTEEGFAYFPKPIEITDIRGKVMLIHAVLWVPLIYKYEDDGPTEFGYAFYSWNDGRNQPDVIAQEIMAQYPEHVSRFGYWGFVGITSVTDGQRVGPETIGITEEERERIISEGDTPSEITNIIRFMHAYFLLLNQTITDVSEAEIGRQFAKRARRAGLPDRVTVVQLRRTDSNSHGETDVEWQHQWLVRGHWRWQHVSENHPLAEPDGKGGYVARVWVRPHLRGPEDKPLLVTDKVYALVR
jgi:hypothetical protein